MAFPKFPSLKYVAPRSCHAHQEFLNVMTPLLYILILFALSWEQYKQLRRSRVFIVAGRFQTFECFYGAADVSVGPVCKTKRYPRHREGIWKGFQCLDGFVVISSPDVGRPRIAVTSRFLVDRPERYSIDLSHSPRTAQAMPRFGILSGYGGESPSSTAKLLYAIRLGSKKRDVRWDPQQ
jgi:hypothetical protein